MELIILIGLQASGKSSFFRTHWAATHEHVSKDLFRNNKNPRRRQIQLIESALEAGRSVVVDNTNVTVEERAALIQLGRMYRAEITGYFFESQVSACIERNKLREGKARVPVAAIYVAAKKLLRPSYAEGFDKLCYVRIANDSTFAIQEWPDDTITQEQQ